MIDLPRWDAAPGDATRCLSQVDGWAKALRDHGVVSAFSRAAGDEIRGLHDAELLGALDDFAAEYWDFRGGRERNLASIPELSSTQSVALDSAASHLGLAGTHPPRRSSYDAVIMTGGMVRAGIVKPRFARELFEQGLEWKKAVFLGGFRQFAGDEVVVAPLLGVHGDNEFDAMVAGMRLAFDLGEPQNSVSALMEVEDTVVSPTRGNGVWREDTWSWNGRTLAVLAAPSSDPENRRANTVDTFKFWGTRTQDVHSVLVITTPVYVPYQGASAIETLGIGFGIAVETIAVSAAASELGPLTQEFLPRHQAQELRSAIRGYRSLRERLSDPVATL